jgi:hypothetical protein
MQMAQGKKNRDHQHSLDKQYYKPHYGPEETSEVVIQMNDENAFKKTFINQSLKAQYHGEQVDHDKATRDEKARDREYLRVAIELQTAEDMTKKQKEQIAR